MNGDIAEGGGTERTRLMGAAFYACGAYTVKKFFASAEEKEWGPLLMTGASIVKKDGTPPLFGTMPGAALEPM